MRNYAYAYWLDNIKGIGRKTRFLLVSHFGKEEAVYNAKDADLSAFLSEKQLSSYRESKLRWNVEESYKTLQKQQISFVPFYQEAYPYKLREIPDKPYGIYVKGSLPDPFKKSVAIIGARECSAYGRFLARECGAALARSGIQVISGMARGVDGISQKGAMDAGGSTFAVLGNGVNICYPLENQALFQKIPERGGLLSEYPPDMEPAKGLFPLRNRIISGLSDAVLVVEARKKSGTRITVDMALEQGREVFFIPGRITDRLSEGCNELIGQGGEIVLSVEAFVERILEGFQKEESKSKRSSDEKRHKRQEQQERPKQNEKPKQEDSRGRKILQTMDVLPMSIDEIYLKMEEEKTKNLPSIEAVMEKILELEMQGMIMKTGGQYSLYRREKNF